MLTAYRARVLAQTRAGVDKQKEASATSPKKPATHSALQRALDYLSTRAGGINEPYLIAQYALAALDAQEMERAGQAAEKLRALARHEEAGSYWSLETSTPFYGWGMAGRIETTALAVQALARLAEAAHETKATATGTHASSSAAGRVAADESRRQGADDSQLINRGLLFLLSRKDRYGVWYSTQATVNALDTIITLLGNPANRRAVLNATAEVFVNGRHAASLQLPMEDELDNPVRLDISGLINTGSNVIEIKRAAGSTQATAQLVSTYYVPWTVNATAQGTGATGHANGALRLSINFDKREARIGEEVTCRVVAERAGFHGYGMMLAEVGLPPGADVDRASLERAMKDSGWSIGRYDVLPDRLVIYLWPRTGGTRFEFKFRPRFGLAARTAPSLIYDYYNPEARTLVAPTDFVVR
jgi:hypothetical protein